MRRFRISDEQWNVISDLFPAPASTDRPRSNLRVMLDACFWILNTGSPPARPARVLRTLANRVRTLQHLEKNGLFERFLDRLHLRLDEAGLIDLELWCLDGATVPQSQTSQRAGPPSRSATRSS